MAALNKEKLIAFLSDLHARELNAYTGASSVGGPTFSPNVLVEVMRKIEAGSFDPGAEKMVENTGLVHSFIEGFAYLPRFFFKGMSRQEVAQSLGIGLFIIAVGLLVGALVVMVAWTVG